MPPIALARSKPLKRRTAIAANSSPSRSNFFSASRNRRWIALVESSPLSSSAIHRRFLLAEKKLDRLGLELAAIAVLRFKDFDRASSIGAMVGKRHRWVQ